MGLGTQGVLPLPLWMTHSRRQESSTSFEPRPALELLSDHLWAGALPALLAESQRLIPFLGDQGLLEASSQEAPAQAQPSPTPGNVH